MDIIKLEKTLWDSACKVWWNEWLKLSNLSEPILGLIFLKFAQVKFDKAKIELEKEYNNSNWRQRELRPDHYHAKWVIYLWAHSNFNYLLHLPESENLGKAINEAMKEVEENNPDLKWILPKSYNLFKEKSTLIDLLRNFNSIPDDIEWDAFWGIYEYFLGKFALWEGQKWWEFFTPTSIVKLIVEIIEPYHGKIYDPACGSGGMFVQSLNFIKEHKKIWEEATKEISVYGQEKTPETVKIAKLNLAINGLSGDIKNWNTMYEDMHKSIGQFDFVMANPPFNLKQIDKEKIKDDPRYNFGIPNNDNANYLWVQAFYSALNDTWRAWFVMSNNTSDSWNTENEIRKKLIENNAIDVMVSVWPNMFYNVTLPCTLWFMDKAKANTPRKNKVLFIDAKDLYNQIDRAHREFLPEHIEKIANTVRAYRQEEWAGEYSDIKWYCRVASLEEIGEQWYSLNPWRYVWVTEKEKPSDEEFSEKITRLNEDFRALTNEAHELEKSIFENMSKLV